MSGVLDHLRVVNLGVLEDAAIDPSPGFTVVTGETGAGKTLLLGGLRLILGGRADPTAIGPGGDEARVEGLFVVDGTEIGATRVMPREGRSRSHLEGAIVSAATLGERLGSLVEIVGQHDQLVMTRRSHLLELIDGTHEGAAESARDAYVAAWTTLNDALGRQRQLGGDQMALARDLDLARYQAEEISAAELRPGLDDELEAEVSRLRNVAEITEHLAETVNLAGMVAETVGELVSRLRKAAGLDPRLGDLAAEAEGLAAAITELGRGARSETESLPSDERQLDELEGRLTTLGELKRKYGRTVEDVIEFSESASRRATELEELLNSADRIDTEIAEARALVRKRARTLHDFRQAAALRITESMAGHLSDLGMASALVSIDVEEAEPGPSGADRVTMHFASDARMQPGDIAVVASGGELSRLVLALRLATRSDRAATLVFDEVDTGIGGKTALAMGEKLAELARSSQVLCVTHLPQVAARADTHYVVERSDDGPGVVRRVDGEERISEITRMLAGLPDSKAGRTAATELLGAT